VAWKTRTRNKILIFSLIFIALCIGAVFYGWLTDKKDAPAMLTALVGSGGGWAVLNGFAVAWEKIKGKGGGDGV
jgi:MFS family permease